MNILVTGATGFIGNNLCSYLIEKKFNIFLIVRPQTKIPQHLKKVKKIVYTGDTEKLQKFIEKNKIDGVIHLASLFLAIHNTTQIRDLINSNILFSTEILDIATKAKVKWFINTGTFWQHYNQEDYNPTNLYSATKQAFEDLAKYYIETTDINFVTIKLSDTFGLGDTRQKIFNIWNKSLVSGEAISMSPGEQIIDISYIENIIDGFAHMINLVSKDKSRKLNGKTFAIKSTKRLTLKKLSTVFEKVTGKKLNINWGGRPYRPREVMVPWTKGKNIPGWKPKYTLEEGIKKTILK